MLMMTRQQCATATVVLCMAVSCAHAQMAIKSDNKPVESKPMAGDMAGKSVDDILSIYEHNIVGAAEAMPAEKYGFAPTQAIFMADHKVDFDTPRPVMTFAREVQHLTQANYGFFAVEGMKPDAEMKTIGELKTKEEIVAALKKSFAFAHKSVMAMTAANAFTPMDSEGFKSTRAASYAFGLAHMGDHYGQLVEYLRMNAIVPPASRK